MSTYLLTISNAAGVLTPSVTRGGTPATGGTALTIPTGELFAGTTQTSTKLIGLAIDAAGRAVLNDFVSNPTSTYYITCTDDGSGNFTPVARRAGTASSGGTALSLPNGELFAGTTKTTTLLTGLAIGALKRAAMNDRAAGN